MSTTFKDITGAELLRADSYSQKIYINDKNGHQVNLISAEQFWSTQDDSKRLYYDYKNPQNKGWAVQQNGWNDYSQDKSQHLTPVQVEQWINKKVFCDNISTLSIIQGYAGCGKTVFINSFFQNPFYKGTYINYNDIYVDYDTNAAESGYLPSSIRNHIITQIADCLLQDDGLEIYNRFVKLLSEFGKTSASFSDLLPLFRQAGQISTLANLIFENRHDPKNVSLITSDFRIQFISGTLAISGALKGKLLKDSLCLDDLSEIEERYIKSLLENYIILDYILLYSISLVRKQGSEIVFYDNLDIIDNPQHIIFFLNKLQETLHRISLCFNNKNYPAPIFNVIIAVRKITYSIVSSFAEVNDPERGFDDVHINFLDISNLYSSVQLLKHKAKVLLDNFQDYIPIEYNRTDVAAFLNALIQVPEEVLGDICLPELFNHNIRACANILERAMNHSLHIIPNRINIKKMSDKCNSAIWIHNICAVLHEKEIWRSLGYNTNDRSKIQFPTTLSRLILTYLYNQRRGFRDGYEGFESTEVSFKRIIEVFEMLPFYTFPRNYSLETMAKETEKNYSRERVRSRIISILSSMLKRNVEADRINPKSEMELWRRPIYFTKNAFSLTDRDGNSNVEKELARQIRHLLEDNACFTDFCITDEGFTFIERIATNFEFYSVRYNGNASVPLCYLTDEKLIDDRVGRVYSQVDKCVSKHQWFMSFYIRQYGKSKNNPLDQWYKKDVDNYLSQLFHPRTDKNKPQLHIVRTIYDHIYYLNDYRDYLIEINHEKLDELNRCLIKWIGKYLELYREHLYALLDDTVGSYNEVFLDLKYLYWRICSDPTHLPYEDNKIISISRSSLDRKASKVCIDDDTLKNDPMLIE